MEELIKKLENLDRITNYFNLVRITFGIFDDVGNQVEEITVLNLDGTTSKAKMKLSEIMYLTEKGTITIPPKPVMRRIMEQINYWLPRVTAEIYEKIRTENWDIPEIRDRLVLFNRQINDLYIPNAIASVLSSDNVVSGILNEKEDQNYTFDLKKLKNFIKSRIFFAD